MSAYISEAPGDKFHVSASIFNKSDDRFMENMRNHFDADWVVRDPDALKSLLEGEEVTRVGFILSVRVDEELRGQGFGNDAMSYLMDEMHNCDLIFLESSTEEEDEDEDDERADFDLEEWYESFGFVRISDNFDNPVMVFASDKLEASAKWQEYLDGPSGPSLGR